MEYDISLNYLNDFFPHITNTIPATVITCFSCSSSLSHPIFLPARTQIVFPTILNTPLKLQTCFDLTIFPFEIQAISKESIVFTNHANEFHWKSDQSLTFTVVDSIDLFHILTTQTVSLQSNNQTLPLTVSFNHLRSRGSPYELINDLCNNTPYILSLQLQPKEDIILTDPYFKINLSQTLSHTLDNPSLHINAVLCENRIIIQSDPIRIMANTLKYPITVNNTLSNYNLNLLSDKQHCYLDTRTVLDKCNQILSIPIDCYQETLYKALSSESGMLADKQDFIHDVRLISDFSSPIKPVYHYPTHQLLDILNCDYLSYPQYQNTKQILTSFIKSHIRQSNPVITNILDAIDHITLHPTQCNTLTLCFCMRHHDKHLLLFIQVMSAFFYFHRPINTFINVTYEIL